MCIIAVETYKIKLGCVTSPLEGIAYDIIITLTKREDDKKFLGWG